MAPSSQAVFQSVANQQTNIQLQSPILSSFQGGQTKLSYVSQSGGVIYAQPSQIIPGSPVTIRRNNSIRSQSADRKSDGMVFNFL